ncbi:hypothetical protein C8J57DRAFT_1250951 [Mycena rebaudengoi]|nr:hypothetical protein C8J57DRAFT_1250951 [Mycena rebaudengoi]
MLSRLKIALAAALVTHADGADGCDMLLPGSRRPRNEHQHSGRRVPELCFSHSEIILHIRYSHKTRGPLHTNEGEIPARFSRRVDVDTLIRQGHTGYIPVESFNTQFGYCVLEHFKAPLSPAPSWLGICGIKRELEVMDKKYGVREKKVKEERKDVGV